jgi:protein-S-isoprenylcysteine O-methyltransferase Ste14
MKTPPTLPLATVRVPVPPPAWFFLILLAAVAIDYFIPLQFLPDTLTVRFATAAPFFVIALLTGVWAISTFGRRRTSPDFGATVTALVQEGPYRFSRNPLYLALVLVLAGFSSVLNNLWLAFGVLLLVILLDRLVIAREEHFLSDLFGAEYLSYRQRVRRWI